ncbi:hypothetical protein EXU30_09935 [Shewanella maritima]|uniref:Uncharacterized protein n=1 Tax=Shewanella maritima TaxID=2520507 RepID=A0A411PHG5_9GAMM|nr:hypothetical protein [Shewanella maritima]QBF82975.1 hypothetical protein EXU30_09935 [Shewanella maritima]
MPFKLNISVVALAVITMTGCEPQTGQLMPQGTFERASLDRCQDAALQSYLYNKHAFGEDAAQIMQRSQVAHCQRTQAEQLQQALNNALAMHSERTD